MTEKKKEYKGLLSFGFYGDDDDILFLSSVSTPLAEELQWMVGKWVTVRYWVTDKQATREEAQADFIGQLYGQADGIFKAHYSEITGHLWTDEKLIVGGHDLILELRSYVGKWLIMEIKVD